MANPNQISVCIYVDLSPPKFCIWEGILPLILPEKNWGNGNGDPYLAAGFVTSVRRRILAHGGAP